MTIPRWVPTAGIILVAFFGLLWMGECFSRRDDGDGMSDSTRARLDRLAADSAKFYEATARRDSLAAAALRRADEAEQRANIADARRRQVEREIRELEGALVSDSTPRDSIITLSTLVLRQRMAIEAGAVTIAELRTAVDGLRGAIVQKDSTIAADTRRLADLEQVVTDLRTDLSRATECRVDLGLFDFTCPSRKAVSVVSFAVGVGATLLGVAAIR